MAERQTSGGSERRRIENVVCTTYCMRPCHSGERGRNENAKGPRVIPLFTVPVLLAVAPFAFLTLRYRSFLIAVFAFLLAGQAAIGMSGYGLAFAPSSVLLMLAGFIGLLGRGAQPVLGLQFVMDVQPFRRKVGVALKHLVRPFYKWQGAQPIGLPFM